MSKKGCTISYSYLLQSILSGVFALCFIPTVSYAGTCPYDMLFDSRPSAAATEVPLNATPFLWFYGSNTSSIGLRVADTNVETECTIEELSLHDADEETEFILIRPNEQLSPNTMYTLYEYDMNDDEEQRSTILEFTTTDTVDTEPPEVPVLLGASWAFDQDELWGDFTFIHIQLEKEATAQQYFYVEASETESFDSYEMMYTFSQSQQLLIPYNRCVGYSSSFMDTAKYLRIKAIDLAGNTSSYSNVVQVIEESTPAVEKTPEEAEKASGCSTVSLQELSLYTFFLGLFLASTRREKV